MLQQQLALSTGPHLTVRHTTRFSNNAGGRLGDLRLKVLHKQQVTAISADFHSLIHLRVVLYTERRQLKLN